MNPQEIEQDSLDADLMAAFDEQPEDAEIEATPEIEIEAEAEPEIETAPEDAPEVETVAEKLAAPSRWSAEAKKAFDSWSEVEGGSEYQKAMLDQYGQTQGYLTQKEQEAAHYRKASEEWGGVFKPFEQQLKQQGVTGPQFMQQLLSYYQEISSNPAQAIEGLAKNYNIDLSTIGADQPYQSPQEVALQRRLDQLENAQRNNLLQARQQEEGNVTQLVQSFANETDASGELLRPHLNQVGELMGKLIRSNTANGLEDAYEMACKLDPDVSAQSEAKRLEQSTARKADAAKKALEAAKRPKGKHTGKVIESISLEDELMAAFDS